MIAFSNKELIQVVLNLKCQIKILASAFPCAFEVTHFPTLNTPFKLVVLILMAIPPILLLVV